MFKFWKKDKKEEEKLTKEVDQTIEKVEEKEDADKVVEEFLEDIESKEKAKEENILNEEIEEIKKETSEIEREAEEMFEKDLDLEELENIGNDKPQMEKKGLFSRLLEGLSKTKDNITGRIDSILNSYTKIDEDLLEELEEILITADVGVNTTMVIIDKLRELIKERGIKDPSEVRGLLKEIVEEILSEGNSKLDIEPAPAVIVMVGVNGVGKTTTIGKLALRYKAEGKKVMLAAADTFRAAAS